MELTQPLRSAGIRNGSSDSGAFSLPSAAASARSIATAAWAAGGGEGLWRLTQPALFVRAIADVSAILDALPPLARKVSLLYVYALLTALWAVLVARRMRPGPQRFLASLPLVVGNLAVPLLLDPASEALLITPLAGVFSLAAFKLLAYSIARGPLMPDWLTPLQFCGVFLLPIVPIQVFTVGSPTTAHLHTIKHGRQLLLSSWANTGTAMLVSWVLALPYLPVMVRHWLYTLASATFLTGVFDITGAMAYLGLGITAAPTFDRPWLSDSFQDFWARRWNLTTTYMMRVLVYEPIMEGRLLPLGCGSSRGKSAAAAATATTTAAAAAAAAPLVVAASPGPRAPSPPQDGHNGCLAPADAAAAPAPPATDSEEEFLVAKTAVGAAAAPMEDEAQRDTGGGLRQRHKAPDVVHELCAGDASHTKTSAKMTAAATVSTAADEQPSVSKMRRFVALQAVFLFSGLWHILIFWYNTHMISWRWCAFFAIQAPILMMERVLRRLGRKRSIRLPRTLQVFTANFLLIAVARPLFFGPTDATGFAARNLSVGQAPLWAILILARRVGKGLHES